MPHTVRELKKALIQQGFEVYRTQGDWIVLADRVRDNLIMDSGVAALAGEQFVVRIVLRTQSSDFPGDGAESLLDRARRQGTNLTARGYGEATAKTVPILDPGDRTKTLDIWYEVSFERRLATAGELYDELRFALELEKTVPGRSG